MKTIVLKNYSLMSVDEHKALLSIRNEESIRKVSLSSEIIALENHLSWVQSLKEDTNRKYFSIIYEDEIIGGVNVFDISKKIKWGIFFKESTSLMIKSIIPIYFIDFIFEQYNMDLLYSEVLEQNANAISFDKNLGFEVISKEENVLTMKMDLARFTEAKNGIVLKRIVKKIKNYNFEIKD